MKNLCYFLLILLGCACNRATKPNDQPQLTVTIEPLRYFTETIAGNHYQVTSMVPEGSSPETYDPTPQQLVNLSRSQAYLRIGHIGFEQAWMKKLQDNAPQMKVYDTSVGISFIRAEGHRHGNHYHEGGIEPHIWNSAQNACLIADNICNAICELDSTHQVEYRHRTDSLKQLIKQTDKSIRSLLQDADRTFLIYHPALSYFARDYGLKQISIEEGGKEPSPTQLKDLMEICRKEKVRIIFIQQEFDQRNAQLIASELGIEIVSIHPLSYHWHKEMTAIANALHQE